jgi:hypothetical protein
MLKLGLLNFSLRLELLTIIISSYKNSIRATSVLEEHSLQISFLALAQPEEHRSLNLAHYHPPLNSWLTNKSTVLRKGHIPIPACWWQSTSLMCIVYWTCNVLSGIFELTRTGLIWSIMSQITRLIEIFFVTYFF